LLQSSAATVLLDCGFGSFDSLATLRPNVRLDAMILSHAHPDHVADLRAFLAEASRWRTAPHVIASRETIDGVPLNATTLGPRSLNCVSDGEHVMADGFEAEFSSTTHQIPTLGVQVTMGGSRVVYSADTGPKWIWPATFRLPDVAIVECTFEERSDSSSPFHLDAREVTDLVDDLSPSTTLLTHVPPAEDGERRREIVQRFAPATRVVLASVGLTLEVGRERLL
jgi:ribonuclease BN (tRNA processing enzyme)